MSLFKQNAPEVSEFDQSCSPHNGHGSKAGVPPQTAAISLPPPHPPSPWPDFPSAASAPYLETTDAATLPLFRAQSSDSDINDRGQGFRRDRLDRCVRCITQRRKCDSVKPTCSNCMGKKIPCEYPAGRPSRSELLRAIDGNFAGLGGMKISALEKENEKEQTGDGDVIMSQIAGDRQIHSESRSKIGDWQRETAESGGIENYKDLIVERRRKMRPGFSIDLSGAIFPRQSRDQRTGEMVEGVPIHHPMRFQKPRGLKDEAPCTHQEHIVLTNRAEDGIEDIINLRRFEKATRLYDVSVADDWADKSNSGIQLNWGPYQARDANGNFNLWLPHQACTGEGLESNLRERIGLGGRRVKFGIGLPASGGVGGSGESRAGWTCSNI